MARINIENSLWTRGEWLDLVAKAGSADTAIGSLVRVWIVSQRYWFPKRMPIPAAVWKRERLNDAVIECGLAENREDGIYVRGSEEQFAWLFEAQIAGQKSGEARKKKAAAKPRAKQSKVGQPRLTNLEPRLTEGEPRSTSLLLSLNSSLSSHDSNSLDSLSGVASLAPDEPLSAITKTWRAYKTAYAQRYGQQPAWGPKAAGQLKEFCKQIPETDAPSVAEFYVRHPKTIYIESMSSIGLMVRDATALRTQWLNGKPLTDGMVSEYRKKAIEPRTRGIAEILADKEKRESEIQLQIGGADGSV